MTEQPIYLDNHATTRVDPRVVEVMLPYWNEVYGNAASISHTFGWQAQAAVDAARESIARAIGAESREIVFTSGATESNNLALRGLAARPDRRSGHIISVATEHKAVVDPLKRLARRGFEVTWLPVFGVQHQAASPTTCSLEGRIDLQQLADTLRPDTLVVSIMWANNEIGVLQPLEEIGRLCHERGVLLHCDATQAVGKLTIDLQRVPIDLLSFTAHKIYGPKGVGALYVRRRTPRIRLEPQIDGGGQEQGLRSGTLNVPGIVGFAKALELCVAELPTETLRLQELRARLWNGLRATIPDVRLNGPSLDSLDLRLPGNLNCSFPYVDGEALMMRMRDIAVSSGSACTSANPEPSHVLRALGLSDDQTRASLRFGLGRFNTIDEIDTAVAAVSHAVRELRKLSSLARP
jgi:cysteine desulfurase